MMLLTFPGVCSTNFEILYICFQDYQAHRWSYSFNKVFFLLYCSGLYSIILQNYRFCFCFQDIEQLLSDVQNRDSRKRPALIEL